MNEWPSVDQTAWASATTAASFFDHTAIAADWRPKSVYQAQAAYGRWLAFVKVDWPSALTESIVQRVSADRARTYVDALGRRITAMSTAAEIGHLVLALSAMAPDTDWKWLRRWQYRYLQRAQPRDKRQRLVHPQRLIDLGRSLMDAADALPSQIEAARQFRDGLIIALLATRPFRRKTLASLRLDRHLHRVGDRFVLAVEQEDTKSGVAFDFEAPQLLTLNLERYLEDYRLRFPSAAAEQALWLSSKGGALGGEAIYAMVTRRTKQAFGFAITLHLFRDIAATTIARDSPEQIGIARDLLTHVKLDTTMRYYTQSQTVQAGRAYDEVLKQLGSANRSWAEW